MAIYNREDYKTTLPQLEKKNKELTARVDELQTRVDELQSRDYIVEQGTSGELTYRKWNSGKAEFWYSESSSSGLNTSVWQSPINYGDYARASLWAGIFNNPPKVYASSNHHWVIAVLPTYISKDGCTLRFLTCGTASNQAYGFSIYAIGTWK